MSTVPFLFIRISETLKTTDPDLIQVDEFKNEQLLSLTINLLLFIRSQVPVTKKLFQSCEFVKGAWKRCLSCHVPVSQVKTGPSSILVQT